MPRSDITLRWQRFSRLSAARSAFGNKPCVYVQTDDRGRPIRVGKASRGLETQYRGGAAYALDAGMHGSGNRIFVAAVRGPACDAVAKELIWRLGDRLIYHDRKPLRPPQRRFRLRHRGQLPRLPANARG